MCNRQYCQLSAKETSHWRGGEGNTFYHIRLKYKIIYLSHVSAEASCQVRKLMLEHHFPLPPLESVFCSCLGKLTQDPLICGTNVVTWGQVQDLTFLACIPSEHLKQAKPLTISPVPPLQAWVGQNWPRQRRKSCGLVQTQHFPFPLPMVLLPAKILQSLCYAEEIQEHRAAEEKKKTLLVQNGRSQNKAMSKAAVVQFGIHQISLPEVVPMLRREHPGSCPYKDLLLEINVNQSIPKGRRACSFNQTSSTSQAPVLENCSQLPVPLRPTPVSWLLMGARAICTACIRLRHHNHSLNAGTGLDKTLLTGGKTAVTRSARDCCPEPPGAAGLHVLQLPASKLGQGYVSSATFCAVLPVFVYLFIVQKLHYLFPDAKRN